MPNRSLEASPSGVARAVAVNTVWGGAGRIAGGIFALFTLAFTSRALGPEGYGGYATILAFLYLFSAIADGGLYQVLVRDISRSGSAPSRLLATALTLRLLSLGGFLLLGAAAFLAIPRYLSLAAGLPFAALSYAALSLAQLLMAVFQKELVVHRASLAEIAARILQLLLTGALFFAGVRTIPLFLAVLAFTSAVQLALMVVFLHGTLRVQIGTTIKEAKAMFREALPVALSLAFTLVYFRLDTIILSLFRDPEEVGIYNLSYKLLEQLIFFPAMFVGVLTPILSDAFVRDRARFQRILEKTSSIIAMGAMPMLVGGWFLAEPLTLLLGGEAFRIAQEPMRVLLIATFLIFFGTLLGNAVVVSGRQRAAVPIYAMAMLFNIAVNVLVIPAYSYMGAAWTTVATELVVTAGLVLVLRRAAIAFTVPHAARIAGAALVMALPLFLFGRTLIASLGVASLAPLLVLCPLLYLGALFAMRAVTREDIRLLFSVRTAGT